MAQAKTKEPNLPAELPKSGVPSFLADSVYEDAGKGVSTAAEDNTVPLVYLLQSGSPQTKSRHPDYIQDAKEGDIWLRGANIVVDGDVGIMVQPCYFWKCWNEWGVPRGTGFFGSHAERPDDAKEIETPDPERPGKTRKMWIRESNGNQVVETRNHAVIVYMGEFDEDGRFKFDGRAFQHVIPMTSTGHTVSKSWMAMMNSKRINGDKAPSFASLYHLTSKGKTKEDFNFCIYVVDDAGWVGTQEQYDLGSELFESFASGALVAAVEDAAQEHDGESAAM